MITLIKKTRNMLISIKNFLVPYFLRIRLDAESYSILKFIEYASDKVKKDENILDAGAGTCPYKKYFSHAKYESTDFEDIFDKSASGKHDFTCMLDNIPKPKGSYDSILCTQVLEHVEEPEKVLKEFHRILKKDGKLFLTVPQGWGLHGEPYHYFNFTRYGLESLFRKSGFKVVFINERGGYFWYLGNRIRTLPTYIYYQYLFDVKKNPVQFKPRFSALLLAPFYLISLPFCGFLFPLLFFYLDRLDKKKAYTLGYACYCIKK